MRKPVCFILAIVLAVISINVASSDECKIIASFTVGSKLYSVNGVSKTMDAEPVMKNGRVFLVVKYVAEAVGANISWDQATKKVTITTKKGEIVEMVIGSSKATRNGQSVQIDSSNAQVTPFVSGGRTLCPLRFTGEVLGAAGENDIVWSQSEQKATLSLDDPGCDEAETPPPGFVKVPANPKLGINEPFYVSKYEMKIKGIKDGNQKYDSKYVAESRADGTPWIGMTMQEAKAECEALGEGYSLISNTEWMAIAHDIESNPKNWSDNKTHLSGRSNAKLNVGNVCRYGPRGNGGRIDKSKNEKYFGEGLLEASTDDSDGCFGYKAYDCGKWGKVSKPMLDSNGWNVYRRTFYLTNGQVLWDFGGNVWSWTDLFVPKARDRARIDGHIDECYLEINACNTFSNAMKPEHIQSLNPEIADKSNYTGSNYYPKGEDKFGVVVNEHTNLNCLGRFHPTSRDDTAGLAMRGTSYMHGDAMAGIYSVAMGYNKDPDHIECEVGFRCVWRPQKH